MHQILVASVRLEIILHNYIKNFKCVKRIFSFVRRTRVNNLISHGVWKNEIYVNNIILIDF